MNKVFKVIWSEARNAYVVVSEIAKNHGSKSCSTKKLLAMLIATGVMTCASMAPAMAATNVDSSAKVNVGQKAEVNVKKNAKVNVEEDAVLTVKNGAKVTFEKGAKIGFENGAKVNLGSNAGITLADGVKVSVAKDSNVSVDQNITIGNKAHVSVWNSVTGKNISGDIAVGPNAHAWNGEYSYGSEGRIGSKEYLLDFGQGGVVGAESFFGIPYKYKVADGSKIAGSIAIGKNTLARTGSVMLGDHSYTGKLGDIEINPEKPMTYNDGIYSTTLGAGAYNSGSLAAVTGALSIASGKGDKDARNTGATIYGSMNSIESATSNSEYSGVASSVLGFANRTQNANAALIWGTGNEVTNSVEKIGIDTDWNNVSVAEAQQKAIEAMQSSKYAGGSVMAIGGGNKADYAKYSQLTGVQNKVTGTKAKDAKYDFVNGYKNTVTEASDVTVIGSKNKVTADGNKVIGDNHMVSGKNNVIFGSADKLTETTVNNAVVLGHNAKVTGEGGVALGAGSVADRANAVSVGSTGANRQIINVAAGTEDTDAVNVSQLKKVSEAAKTEVVKGTNIASVVKTTATDGHTVYTVNAKGTSVSVDGNFNLNTTTDAETNVTNYGISLKDSVTIGGTHAVTINGTDGTVTGLTNTTWNKDSITSGRAATEDQLQAVATEAGKHTTLSNGKNTTVESTVKDGQTDYKVNVAGDLTDITSVANGDSKIKLNKDSIIISNGNKYFAITNSGIGMSYIGADYSAKSIMLGENGTTISGGLNVAGSKITGVEAGVADTDAVNVGQLKEAVQAGNTDTHIKPGEYGVGADNKVNMDVVDKNGNKVDTVTIKDVAKASDVGNVNNIADDIKNGEGHTTVVDAVNNLNNKVGDLQYSKVEKGDIADGDSTTTAIGKLDQKLTDVAATAAKHTKVEGGNNITVTNTAKEGEAANYKVELNKDIDVDTVTANTVTTGKTVMNNDGVKVGTDVSLNKDGLKVGDKVSVSATAVTAGQTSINNDGLAVGPNTSLKADELKVDGKTYIDKNGLNANGMQITNVADGKENSDAVNVGQLKESEKTINNRINGVENQVISNSNRINQLGNRVNKVGAGAAALAALHPMDFDPDDKLTFSAGYGNYAGENAAAIGAYYRPDEKVMFSVAGTVGNGENMVNAGVSFALDRTNHVSNSRTALAREVIDLRGQLAVMGAKMAKMEKALGMLDETKTKLFPDIPANHWAYEYIAKLAGNGYIEGYPDGNFGGDRLMTRYEFAAMLYRAIENGAALEEKIIKEFEPELGRIRVDRISGEDGDRDKIERVRVNDTKGERDHYGNKLAK